MDNTREKLIQLIEEEYYCSIEEMADHMIANGVTILPCKIGDEFWIEWVGIRKVRCSMLTQKADGSWKGRFTVEKSGGSGINIDFGENTSRVLFITKEDAETYFTQPPNEVST